MATAACLLHPAEPAACQCMPCGAAQGSLGGCALHTIACRGRRGRAQASASVLDKWLPWGRQNQPCAAHPVQPARAAHRSDPECEICLHFIRAQEQPPRWHAMSGQVLRVCRSLGRVLSSPTGRTSRSGLLPASCTLSCLPHSFLANSINGSVNLPNLWAAGAAQHQGAWGVGGVGQWLYVLLGQEPICASV
jgi:hypothetical protein